MERFLLTFQCPLVHEILLTEMILQFEIKAVEAKKKMRKQKDKLSTLCVCYEFKLTDRTSRRLGEKIKKNYVSSPSFSSLSCIVSLNKTTQQLS